MSEITPVVVAAQRTPFGKEGGVFADVRPEDLSVAVIDKLLAETGLTGEAVDDLMWGCAQQRAEQGNNMARIITLLSALGESVPGTTINRWCASSAQAIMSAADAIRAGQRSCIVAGGVESMSAVEMGFNSNIHPRLTEEYNLAALQMGMTAEEVADRYDVSREAQDDYAYRSHERAAEAATSGRFGREIVPVDTAPSITTRESATTSIVRSSRRCRRCSSRMVVSHPATPRRSPTVLQACWSVRRPSLGIAGWRYSRRSATTASPASSRR